MEETGASLSARASPVRGLADALARAPLAPAAVGVMTGVVLDDRLHPPVAAAVLAFFAAVLPGLVLRLRLIPFALTVFVAAVGVGAMLHAQRIRLLPPDSVAEHLAPAPRLVRLFGKVASPPRILAADREGVFAAWQYHGERTTFLLDVFAAEAETEGPPTPLRGRVRVTVQEAVLGVREGEKVEVFGWLGALTGARNPGSYDWGRHFRRQGIVGAVRADHRLCVRLLDPGEAAGRGGVLERWRARARGWLIDDLAGGSEEGASLLSAMVLGHRSVLDRRLNEVFIDSGCIHFLAVSGTHVLMLMAAAWAAGRMLGLPRVGAAWGVAGLLVVYALVAEPRPPILRATITGLLYCGSVILRRGAASLNWLSAAALVLVAVHPAHVFDAGFQLSFAAVLGVAYVAPSLLTVARVMGGERSVRGVGLAGSPPLDGDGDPPWRRRAALMVRAGGRRLARGMGVALAVSAGAWVMGLPISLYHFQRLQPWGAVNSVVVLPLVTALTVLGAVKTAAASVSPAASGVLGWALSWGQGVLVRLVERLAELPGASWFGASPPAAWMIGFYGAVALFVAWFPPAWFGEAGFEEQNGVARRRWWAGAAALVAAAVALGLGTYAVYGPRRLTGRLEATALAVGAGAATVVELPDGRAVLIDAGSSTFADAGRSTILPFLRQRGIRRLDAVLISHANLDHFSALPDVLERVGAREVIFSPYFGRDAAAGTAARRLLDVLAERGVAWRAQGVGAMALDDEVTFYCHWPPEGLDANWSSNETSLVVKIGYAGRTLLSTGDIEIRAQSVLRDRADVRADVLFLPHHGGMSEALGAFVGRVGAGVWIRSAREAMHETATGLAELAAGAALYNTADVGAVVIRVDADGGMTVTTPCAARESGGMKR